MRRTLFFVNDDKQFIAASEIGLTRSYLISSSRHARAVVRTPLLESATKKRLRKAPQQRAKKKVPTLRPRLTSPVRVLKFGTFFLLMVACHVADMETERGATAARKRPANKGPFHKPQHRGRNACSLPSLTHNAPGKKTFARGSRFVGAGKCHGSTPPKSIYHYLIWN